MSLLRIQRCIEYWFNNISKKCFDCPKFIHFFKLLSSKTSELESLKSEWNSRMADLKARNKEELSTEKEKALQASTPVYAVIIFIQSVYLDIQ